MIGIVAFLLLSLTPISLGTRNSTNEYVKLLSDLSDAEKRSLPPAGCAAPEIENTDALRSEALPPTSGTWTYPIYCKTGYSLIGPCRLVCRETAPENFAFSPPSGLEMPFCVKDYAASQFRCHYLSSACPVVWDHDPDPAQPSIAISRIFCGQITNPTPNVKNVEGFAASMFATPVSGSLCEYKTDISTDPCFIMKGERDVPVARGNSLPAITYLGNMDGYEALSGAEDPYIGKLSRKIPYYLFPPGMTPSDLVSRLREYFTKCKKRNGAEVMKCTEVRFLTSTMNGYDVVIRFGGDKIYSGIIDAYPVRPSKHCIGMPCCCDLNEQT